MGFMGSCPIAGVIWQHIHYIVGLQKLGHDVFYIEDSARIPYNPVTFDVCNDYTTPHTSSASLQPSSVSSADGAFARAISRTTRPPASPLRKSGQLYREADAILNVCGTQEFNDDLLESDRILYIESDPGVEQIKVDQGVKSTIKYLRRHHALFTFGENVGTENFRCRRTS